MSGAVGILSYAGQILNRLVAVANRMHRVQCVGLPERPAHQFNVILIIFG